MLTKAQRSVEGVVKTTNMKISRLLYVLAVAISSAEGLADQLPGIAEFTDGEPALAKEVNGNNLVISDKAQELEARILQLENVSDRLVRDEDAARYGGARSAEPSAAANKVGGLTELLGGKLYLDNIDCNADPHALNKAYIDNSQYSYIQFTITGSCYGHFTLIDGTDPTAGELQEHGQAISIVGNVGTEDSPLPRPKLIANPFSNNMSLYGSFGGGLYIKDVDIDVSMAAGWGVLFSRGTTGDIARSTITCTAEDNAVKGIWIQNGASPYIYTVDVVDCDVGMFGRNNVSAAIYYHVSITGARLGVELRQGSSVNARGVYDEKIDIDASDWAITLDGASQMKLGRNGVSTTSMEISGGIQVLGDSNLTIFNPLTLVPANSPIEVTSSQLRIRPRKGEAEYNVIEDYWVADDLNVTCNGLAVFNVTNPETDAESTTGSCHVN